VSLWKGGVRSHSEPATSINSLTMHRRLLCSVHRLVSICDLSTAPQQHLALPAIFTLACTSNSNVPSPFTAAPQVARQFLGRLDARQGPTAGACLCAARD
jgi:hypothetical protein